ncbi:Kelch motif-containing protein [Hathewaya proteolytica DSM 3090]|uniref:Kelch motif-containing protein n=1 Tax=Hathewaya proteolytica DSM 3090 TaxID=1121331 RepID=A0A1M6L031_9CLOT|nr:kelch repeat-containing protein [Hathewaya proteolytica]SHJ64588.1 Kelch motif-containing protein [Hathewaya proteolytica DSM 3090]
MAIMYKDGDKMCKIAKIMYLDTATNTIKTMTSCKGLVDGVVREFLPQQSPINPIWSEGYVMEHQCVSCMGYSIGSDIFYVEGKSTSEIGAFYMYNTINNSRTSIGSCSVALSYSAHTLLGNEFVMYGGQNYGATQRFYQKYNLDTKKWTSADTLTIAKQEGTAQAYNGLVYIFGGYNISQKLTFNTLDIFNPISNTVSAGATMPQARRNMKSVIIDSKVYMFGGGFNTILTYDILTQTYNEISTLPNNAVNCDGCVVVNNKIYVLINGDVYIYNHVNNTFSDIITTMPIKHNKDTFMINCENKIYFLGGQLADGTRVNKISILTL